MTDNNEWGLGSGLALDGAKVEVTAAEFGFNNAIGAGVVCANLTFTNLEDGEDIEQSFSVGKGWDVSRDGSLLTPENPKSADRKTINMQSTYGLLIQSAAGLVDTPGDINPELWKEHGAKALRHAAFWLHTMWTMGTVVVRTTNPSTGQEKDATKFVFTEFRGGSVDASASKTKGGGGSKASGTKSTSSRVGGKASAARSKAKADDGPPEGIDEDLWEQLLTLAREIAARPDDHDDGNDHDAFMEAAFDLDEVEDSKAGSVWAAR